MCATVTRCLQQPEVVTNQIAGVDVARVPGGTALVGLDTVNSANNSVWFTSNFNRTTNTRGNLEIGETILWEHCACRGRAACVQRARIKPGKKTRPCSFRFQNSMA